jgi:MFS family permease
VSQPNIDTHAQPIPRYSYYALAVLMMACVLNFLDRLILSILGQDVKADLGLDDAQLGFLIGTAFAVFYAIVGIAMGRISDAVSRTRLMACGLALWSAMTALGAATNSFAGLALARIGVGVGEATANPSSHSLLSQYFPPRRRATALSFYLSGTFIGGAASMLVGGLILQHWSEWCRIVPWAGACGMASWKAALLVVGLPGLPLALLVATLREPARPDNPSVPLGRLIVKEFAAALPPFTLYTLWNEGGARAVTANLTLIALLVAIATALTHWTHDLPQWASIALGAYAIITWSQIHKYRDAPFYRLTFGCPTFVMAMLSGALIACIMGAVNAWSAPYAMRTLSMSPGQTGLSLGLSFALSAGIGVVAGGLLTDRWKQRDARAPIWVAGIALCGALPALMFMMSARDVTSYVVAFCVFGIFGSCWSGAFAALVQDLVLPRMRGAAASSFALVHVVIAAGAGPYWVGKVSALTGSLETGLLSVQALTPFAITLLILTALRLPRETAAARAARAKAAGEASPTVSASAPLSSSPA